MIIMIKITRLGCSDQTLPCNEKGKNMALPFHSIIEGKGKEKVEVYAGLNYAILKCWGNEGEDSHGYALLSWYSFMRKYTFSGRAFRSRIILSSSLSLKCALRESSCRIGCEPKKMSRDHFWRSISRETNVEVSALSPSRIITSTDGLSPIDSFTSSHLYLSHCSPVISTSCSLHYFLIIRFWIKRYPSKV